jgi:hypothetical protein
VLPSSPRPESATPHRRGSGLRVLAAAFIVPLLVSAGLAIGAVPANADNPTGTLDQSNTGTDGSYSDNHPGFSWIQTFTVGLSGTLSAVELAEAGAGPAGTVQIVALDSGTPTENVLASATLPSTSGGGWVTASFTSSLPVIAGAKYGIRVVATSGTIMVDESHGSAYAGGSVYQDDAGSISAYSDNTLDFDFMTYVDTSNNAVPALTGTPAASIVVNRSYSFSYGTSGFPDPVVSVTSGTLPPGLQLSQAGVLSGTPTTNGDYPFTVQASNGVDPAATVDSEITVRAPKAPGAPTIGIVTAYNGEVVVNFTAPADPGDSPITSYTVIASPGGITGSGASSPVVVNNLTNGTMYTFTVRATNNVGPGTLSAPSTATTPYTVPNAPTALTATPQSHAVQLSWTAPDNGGAAISGYEVQDSTDGRTWRDADGGSVGTSDTITGLTNGTTYYFRVAAKNVAGESGWSGSANTVPRTVAGAPTGVGASPSDGSVALTWSASTDNGGSAVTGYSVQYSQNGTDWADGGSVGSSPAALSGLTDGTSYQFRVAAVNPAGTGPWSSPVTATPFTTPDAPDGLEATPGGGEADLTWNTPFDGGSSVIQYDIEYRVTGGDWVDGAPSIGTSSAVTGLDNGTAYEFRVRAENAAGAGGWSDTATTTPRTVPDAPAWSGIVPSNGEVQLSWSAPADGGADITGYLLQKSIDGTVWSDVASGTATSADVTGLTNGTAYSFRVRATNAAGDGAFSEVTSSTPRTVPGVPVWVSVVVGDGVVGLGWDAPADGGASITGYTVQQSINGIDWADVAATTTLAAVVGGLDDGTEYFFRVVAANVAGDGVPSVEQSATPRTTAGVPAIDAVTPGDGAVSLAWTVPTDNGGATVTGYDLRYSTDGTTWTAASSPVGTSATVTGLRNGAEYSFEVRAENAAGAGGWSVAAMAVPRTTPGVPASVQGTGSDATVVLSWDAPTTDGGATVTGYDIQYRPVGTAGWIDGDTGTSSPDEVTGLTDGTSYEFRVRAENAAGGGHWSDPVTVVPFVFTVAFDTADGHDLTGSTLSTGDHVSVSGSDLPPGATITVDLHSTPVTLGTTTVTPDGTFRLDLTIPAGTTTGSHQLDATITGTGLTTTTATSTFALTTTPLAFTGTTMPWPPTILALLLILLGTSTTLLLRRRRA